MAVRNTKSHHFLVYRDKLLLPSEGFIKTHYQNFDKLQPVFVGSKFGWQINQLDGPKIKTGGLIGSAWFKQTGRVDITQFADFAPTSVHAHFGRGGALALPIARSLQVPLFVTYHGGDATKKTHQRKRLLPTVYQRRLLELKEYARGFLCVSKFVAEKLKDQGFPAKKLFIHYIGIDCSRIEKPRLRDGNLLFVGRLTRKKGVDVLIRAIHELSAVGFNAPILDIVGSGPEESKLRNYAVGAKNIRFLGWQTPSELSEHLARCSALIVPSREADDGDCEGLPTVILEGIRAGAPILASHHAGIPEIIKDGITGMLAPENSATALAAMIKQAMVASQKLPDLVKNAQSRIRKDFDASKQSKKLQDILIAR